MHGVHNSQSCGVHHPSLGTHATTMRNIMSKRTGGLPYGRGRKWKIVALAKVRSSSPLSSSREEDDSGLGRGWGFSLGR